MFYTLFILNQNTKAYAGFRGDGIECDLVLGPKARPIPALGNAQGTRKPMRSKQLPSPTARPQDLLVLEPSGGGNQVGLLLFRPQDQGRWPWLVWAAPLVLKANTKAF